MKPNIVLILIDDMGWKDLSGEGSSFYESPNIDSLMASGMGFANSYASCPVCSPSRASLMSGKYPASLGLTDWIDAHGEYHPLKGRLIDAPYVDHLSLDEKSLALALRERGYSTWHVGKWHLGFKDYYPEHHGFDVNIGGCDWGHPHKGYFSPYHIETLEDGPEGEYLTDRLTDEAIRLVRSRGDNPFFLNLWHYAVHTPIQAPEEDVRYFENKLVRLGLDKVDPFIEGEHFHTEDKREGRVRRRIIQSDCVYAAMIRNLDMNVGRLIDTLKEEGIFEDTIIIFTSDNGGLATAEGSPTCNAPAAEGKGWMYEGGTRVPLSISWSGRIKAGSRSDYPVTTPDLYPTVLDLAGLDLMPHQHSDGISLKRVLEGGSLPSRPIFWHYPHYGNQGGTPGSSVLLYPYKLIEFFEDGHTELYDLSMDIGETRDLSTSMPEKRDELLALLREWRERIHARIPERNPEWKE